jgi:hypothetical protein
VSHSLLYLNFKFLWNHFSEKVCKCSVIPSVSETFVPLVNADANTKACQIMQFSQASPYTPDIVCPSNALVSTSLDSCTTKIFSPKSNCRDYCQSFPGLTCLDGAYSDWSQTCALNSLGKIGCDVRVTNPYLWYVNTI